MTRNQNIQEIMLQIQRNQAMLIIEDRVAIDCTYTKLVHSALNIPKWPGMSILFSSPMADWKYGH